MSLSWVVFFGAPYFVSAMTSMNEPELVAGAQIYSRADDEFASAIVIDAATGKRLYAYLPTLEWPAASLTKLMNALVVIDQKPRWTKSIAMSSKDSVGGGQLNVKNGSTIPMKDLFYSSIVASANNAAMALARTSGLGTVGFVKSMNKKALALGLTTTSFADPSGMDPANVTTAAEMAKISAKAFDVPEIRRAATTMSYAFTMNNPTVKKKITNTNKLLTSDDEMFVMGGKTGFLYESRYNLAVKLRTMDKSPDKPPLIIVVLGAPKSAGSFASAKGLAKWAWNAYDWPSSK